MNRKTLVVAALFGALGCGGDNEVTGPSMDDIAGTWTGGWADKSGDTIVERDASLSLVQHNGALTGSMTLENGGGMETITGGTYVARIVTIAVARPAGEFGAARMTCQITDATHCTGTVTLDGDVDGTSRTAAIAFTRPE
jgi:hypothetical protein